MDNIQQTTTITDNELNTDNQPEQKNNTENNVTIIEIDDRKYHIIGTAHVSDESTREVNDYINNVKPDAVCVELCQRRYDSINDENRWKKLNIIQIIKSGQMLFLLANIAIGAYQRRIGAQLGVKPGSELITATKTAQENNAEVILADRDINITLKRTWANLGFFKKMMMLSAILESLIFKKNEKTEKNDIE